jgi:2-oxoglutarate ferredoxin oxidoreductase subunit beta
VDLQIVLFNNEIYGLTKGQYSPTSRQGTKTPTSPGGSLERPLSAAAFALGAGGRFVARGIDTQQAPLVEVLKRAHANRGASFVEVFQNCLVFNDGVFNEFTERSVAEDRQLHVQHGQPLLFGKGRTKGIRLDTSNLALDTVTLGEAGVTMEDILVHDETNRTLAGMLAALEPPGPVALGVLYAAPVQDYTSAVYAQSGGAPAELAALLHQGKTWKVGA